jgi:hypothetical protein
MRIKIQALLCITLLAAMPVNGDAASPRKSRKKKQEATPPPTPTPPGVPSVDLSRFISAHLENILAPLDRKVVLPRAELAQLRNSYSQRFARASLAEREQFQVAISVCDALTQAMNDRNTALLKPSTANWEQRSAQLRQYIQQLAARQRQIESQAMPASGSPSR